MTESITRQELEREITHLKELVAERDKALELQRDEYHRRLDELNNAHARAEKTASMTVSNEVFERFESEIRGWKEAVNTELATMKGSSVASARFFVALITILTIVFSAVTLWTRLK